MKKRAIKSLYFKVLKYNVINFKLAHIQVKRAIDITYCFIIYYI